MSDLISMFTPEQVEKLNAKLAAERVKERKQGGANVSYIEGYSAIETANDIFGFGNWSGRILELTCEVKEQTKDGWYVAYTCRYEITIWNYARTMAVSFDDIGFGSRTSYGAFSALGSSIEGATKEAVTDAMKRAWRNFGNQFGLALYDKEQRNVEQEETQHQTKQAPAPEAQAAPKQEPPFNRDEAIAKIRALKKFNPEIHAPLLIKALTREDMLGLFHSINNS